MKKVAKDKLKLSDFFLSSKYELCIKEDKLNKNSCGGAEGLSNFDFALGIELLSKSAKELESQDKLNY
jgi:hypothetical protein